MHRPGTARPIAVATWVTTALMAAGQLLAGPYDVASTYAVLLGLLFVAALAWATMWRPRVELAPHGVVLRNPLRTVLVTWPALLEVDGRFGLRLRTGEGLWSAWAAAPPAGRARRPGHPSEAAEAVERRWAGVRDRGHLDAGQVEGRGADVRWEVAPVMVLGSLAATTLAASVVSLL